MVARERQGISLALAVSQLGDAAAGVRLLVRVVIGDHLNDRREEMQALEAAASILDLLVTHTLSIQAAMRGDVDARGVRTAGNQAPALPIEGQDLVLSPWDSRHTFERAKNRGAETKVSPRSKRGRR
ncbi:MAG: hypothetical protein IT381_10445 [Deltaproteobacteria bacterium]|nr:hypothetical protein [Deltaproteobacteria bacterium]